MENLMKINSTYLLRGAAIPVTEGLTALITQIVYARRVRIEISRSITWTLIYPFKIAKLQSRMRTGSELWMVYVSQYPSASSVTS
jgi:hypothetical protein